MVNAAIADEYQMANAGKQLEAGGDGKKPQEPPSGGQQGPPAPEEGQEPEEPKNGKEGP